MRQKSGWAQQAMAAATLFMIMHTAAFAQATRTWVSGVGDDANPCSRTAPCKTFAGAISKTAAGGEISVLDPGGYGAVTITKAITINNEGGEAGVLVSGTNGITIRAAATDRVTLRGLTVEGLGTGLSGIRFISGAQLLVEDCRIQGFRGASPSHGIWFAPNQTATARLVVRNSTINSNGQSTGGGGIQIAPASTGMAEVVIEDTVVSGNAGFGVRAADDSVVVIRNSAISGNANNGVNAVSSADPAEITLEDTLLTHNGWGSMAVGVRAAGTDAVIRLSNNVITNNAVGIRADGGGAILSYGNNKVSGNATDGNPTGSLITK